MSESTLKRCPFCGGEAKARKGLDWYVQCTECPAELGSNCDYDGNQDGEYATEDQAIEAWNTRATLGSGTCVPHGEWERLSQTQERRRMYCDCGYELGVDKRDSFPFERTEYAPMPRFCPECGVKLVSKGKAVGE